MDLLQNLLENKFLSASRLQSITSSFDSSFDAAIDVEDEEKKRVADSIYEMFREKLSSVLSNLAEIDVNEILRRMDQWALPTPNSSLNLETDGLRSSNKSASSSRTDSFILYPEGVVSFRNLTPSPTSACPRPSSSPRCPQ